MKHKILIGVLLLSFAPVVVASFLDDIEDHIQNQEVFPESRFAPEAEVIEPVLTDDDSLSRIKSDIFWEEDALDAIEQRLQESENDLWEASEERRSFEQQIFLLDQEIQLVSNQLEEYKNRKNYHQTLLARLTREKSALEATIRVRKRILERLSIRNFLRRGNKRHTQTSGLPSGNFFLTQWLFSNRQLSEVIDTYRKDTEAEEASKTEIKELEILQKHLAKQEAFLAYQTGVSDQLLDLISEQERRLVTFTDAQAVLRDRALEDVQTAQNRIEEYRQQQNESTFALQDLRLSLKTALDGGTPIKTIVEDDLFFGYPVPEPVRITATFHDLDYEERFGIRHDGVDFAVPQGSGVRAVASGVVAEVKDNGLGYSYLILEHAGDTFSLYGHVSSFLVKPGDVIQKGEKIALSGGTPGTPGAGYFTTGPHLHLEFFKDGEYVNPLKFIR